MPYFRCSRKPSTDSYTSVQPTDSEPKEKRPMWQTVLIIIAIVIFVIAFLLFLTIWVALPIAFLHSISFQRFIMFMNFNSPKNPNFDNPSQYGIEGVVNFYITTFDLDNNTLVNIGNWLIIQEDEIDLFSDNGSVNTTYTDILSNTKKPVLIYTHGVACNRAKPIAIYNALRKHFVVVAPDHRGYGDSGSNVELTEEGVVSDTVQLYKWVRAKTNNTIYVWGHSLGAALAIHTVKVLKEQDDIIPMGLVLESAFTTMREEMVYSSLGKIFKWLAYFNQTILDPPESNGFLFRSTTNILSVDCPIMILHAEDDNVVPSVLGQRLYEVAKTERDLLTQGNVTHHQFPAVGYKHISLTSDPKMSQYITDFMQECIESNKARG